MKKIVYSIVVLLAVVPLLLYAQSNINFGVPSPNNTYWPGVDQNAQARAMIGMDTSGRVSLDPDARGAIFGGALTVTGTQTFTGNTTVSGTLGVTGATTLSGAASLNGNTTLGNAATDTVTLTGTLNASNSVNWAQGTQAASANDLDLDETTGNVFEITGTTAINQINTTGFQNGSVIHLLFSAAATMADNQTPTGLTARILSGSSGTITARADEIWTLILTTSNTVRAWRVTAGGNQ